MRFFSFVTYQDNPFFMKDKNEGNLNAAMHGFFNAMHDVLTKGNERGGGAQERGSSRCM